MRVIADSDVSQVWTAWLAWLEARGVDWRDADMGHVRDFCAAGARDMRRLALGLHYSARGVTPPEPDAIRLAAPLEAARHRWGEAGVVAGRGEPRVPRTPPAGPGDAA